MKEMRRADRRLPDERAREILRDGEYGILCTCASNEPLGTPLSYVFDGEYIWIHGAREGLMRSNLSENPRVSFTVVGDTEILPDRYITLYESVIVKGVAELCSGDYVMEGLILITRKYCPVVEDGGRGFAERSLDRVSVYRIKVDEISGKGRLTR